VRLAFPYHLIKKNLRVSPSRKEEVRKSGIVKGRSWWDLRIGGMPASADRKSGIREKWRVLLFFVSFTGREKNRLSRESRKGEIK